MPAPMTAQTAPGARAPASATPSQRVPRPPWPTTEPQPTSARVGGPSALGVAAPRPARRHASAPQPRTPRAYASATAVPIRSESLGSSTALSRLLGGADQAAQPS